MRPMVLMFARSTWKERTQPKLTPSLKVMVI